MSKKSPELFEEPVDLDETPTPSQKKPKKQKKEKNKKKSGVGGKILCLFLGFLFGIIFVVGSVVGTGFWLVSQPTDKALTTIDKITGADLSNAVFGEKDENGNVVSVGVLNDKYAELKISELIGDVIKEVNGIANDGATLNGFNEISPMVGSLVDGLLKSTNKYSIPLDKDCLMSAPFTSDNESTVTIGKYFEQSLLNTPVGDLVLSMGGDPAPILLALCYGVEGEDYEWGDDGKVVMLGEAKKLTLGQLMNDDLTPLISKLPLDAVLKIDPLDSLMCSIAYGSENRYALVGDEVKMTQITYTLDTADGLTLIDDAGERVDGSVTDLGGGLYTLQLAKETQYVQMRDGIGYAYSDGALTTPVLYKKTLVGDLQEDALALLDNLRLHDVMDLNPDSSPVLLAIAYGDDYYIENGKIYGSSDKTIGDLRKEGKTLIDNVALSSVIDEDRSNGMIMHLLYGKKGVHYVIEEGKIVMQQMYIAIASNGNVYNEYGELLTGNINYTLDNSAHIYTNEHGKSYRYAVTSDSKTMNDDTVATVCLLTDLDGNVAYFDRTRLGDLSGNNNRMDNLSKRLTVNEILDDATIQSSDFLKHVQYETIESLPDALNNLTVQQVYASDIYKNGKNGELTAAWWYLLTINGVEQQYKVTEMDHLIENMKNNVHDATIRKLHDDGMITDLDEHTLSAAVIYDLTPSLKTTLDANSIPYGDPDGDGKPVQIGDLTVTQMMLYVNAIFDAIDDLGL